MQELQTSLTRTLPLTSNKRQYPTGLVELTVNGLLMTDFSKQLLQQWNILFFS